MKTDIILAGVGGQGILSIAAALGSAALTNNLYMKQAETHGMSQRGGDVQSFMRISDRPIYSDLIAKGRADIILSVEPMEALRYLPSLREGGFVVTNSTPVSYTHLDVYKRKGTEEEFLEFVQDKGAGTMHDFFLKLDELPFYNRLSAALWNDGKDIDKMIAQRQFNEILSYILTDKGLNYGNTPKGLVDFQDVYKRQVGFFAAILAILLLL